MNSFKITRGSIKNLFRKIFHIKEENWFYDSDHRFNIDIDEVKKYFDSVKSTPLSEKGERIEEETIIDLIKIKPGMKILDLGCGDGRWAKKLENAGVKYIGVDFSRELIAKAKSRNVKGDVRFLVNPVQDFISEEKFDLIFLFGLIPYMNDEEIRKLSRNCRVMLKRGGRLILRDVIFNDSKIERKVFDDKNDFSRRIFFNKIPRYQLIRRSFDSETKLFREFSLVYSQRIKSTNLGIKIFK
jgi:cyclopropane fatty-acyl-phospholipid synthase-like methyltransferase